MKSLKHLISINAAGIYNVVMPKENEKDLRELPKEIIRKTKFSLIESVDELFELCLLDFKPSTHTLEKIFAEEIARAKKKLARKKIAKKTLEKDADGPFTMNENRKEKTKPSNIFDTGTVFIFDTTPVFIFEYAQVSFLNTR